MAKRIEQWQRQEDETSPAFEAFVEYRDMHARSTRKVAEALDKELSQISGWSVRHRWVKRCQLWDNELDRRVTNGLAAELLTMKRQQLKLALGMQSTAGAALDKLAEDLKGPEKKGRISPDNIVRMIDIGRRLERLNRDEPESITKVQTNDFSNLSVEEMLQLRTLLQKSEG